MTMWINMVSWRKHMAPIPSKRRKKNFMATSANTSNGKNIIITRGAVLDGKIYTNFFQLTTIDTFYPPPRRMLYPNH